MGTATLPEPAATAAPAPPARRRAGCAAGHHGRRLGHPHRHRVAAAVDLDVDVAADPGTGILRGVAGGRRNVETGEVEVGLHPPGGVLGGLELGVGEDGHVGRDGGLDAVHDELVERPQHATDGDVPVRAPHDELAHQVVVVLGDLVAGLVAAVPAHAETLRDRQLGDLAG
jgi:hypothetical protein